MKAFLVIAAIVGASALFYLNPELDLSSVSRDSHHIVEAYENHTSGKQVAGVGKVTRILSDDLKGSRHQRFILKLEGGHTLLISHNIDLAPRINSLKIGDEIEFYGVYEWNSKGGVVHWTHDDPKGRHINGWLKKNGKIYQ